MRQRNSAILEEGEPLMDVKNHLNANKNETPALKLLEAWKNGDFFTFCQNISSDLQRHIYPENQYLRLIDLIVKEIPCKTDFLKKTLEFNPKINEPNTKTGYAVTQFALIAGNFTAFWILLEAGADPNNQDKEGNTIMHTIIEKYKEDPEEYLKLFIKFLQVPNVVFNIPNLKGETPIMMAAARNYTDVVDELLKFGPIIDLDTFRETYEKKTARDYIFSNGMAKENVPEPWQPDPERGIVDYRYRLFYYLTTIPEQEKHFIKTLKEALKSEAIDKLQLYQCVDSSGYTYLQQAVAHSKIKAVHFLVENGADVNYAPFGTDPPILISALNKNESCFSYLLSLKNTKLSRNARGETLLHVLAKKRVQGSALRKLLVHHKELDINDQDVNGQTALHLAVTNVNEKTIFILLDHGARLDITNKTGDTPLSHLNAKTYEKYLNTKITINDQVPQDLNYAIFFDYKFLSDKNGTAHVHDLSTEPLRKMLQSKQHKKLLAHPVVASIIFFKWMRIRWLFYLYLFLSILFSALFTAFIFSGPFVSCESCTSSSSFTVNKNFVTAVEWFLLVYLIIRSICEAIDFYSSPIQYLQFTENWLQVSMISSSFVCIAKDCPKYPEQWPHCRGVLGFALLFVWLELFFIIGKHPRTNFFLDMFRTATSFLFQFIAVHTALILAFVFSFSVIFQEVQGPFDSVPKAFFKTLLMVTGEYEAGSLPFDLVPIVSHLLFVLFLFLVAIVFFNLLIGLAVSATKPIEDDSFLYSNMAQVPIIFFIERVFFNDSLYYKTKIMTRLIGTKKKPGPAIHPWISIHPNDKKKKMEIIIKNKNRDDTQTINTLYSPTKRIVDGAQQILATAHNQDSYILEDKIENLQMKLETTTSALEEQIQEMRTSLGKLTLTLEIYITEQRRKSKKKDRGK